MKPNTNSLKKLRDKSFVEIKKTLYGKAEMHLKKAAGKSFFQNTFAIQAFAIIRHLQL